MRWGVPSHFGLSSMIYPEKWNCLEKKGSLNDMYEESLRKVYLIQNTKENSKYKKKVKKEHKQSFLAQMQKEYTCTKKKNQKVITQATPMDLI